jgi:hypothetical protein
MVLALIRLLHAGSQDGEVVACAEVCSVGAGVVDNDDFRPRER